MNTDKTLNQTSADLNTSLSSLVNTIDLTTVVPQRTEIVFIESNIGDYQTLIDGINPGAEIYILDASGDGLAQIAQILNGRSGIDAIHIVSHGAEGLVGLGSLNLTTQNLQQHSTDLASIGNALNQDADILLYGCNVSAGSDGAAFISQLANLTHADIAASNDLTGAAAKDGNWVLESASGQIETAALQFSGFQGILPSVAGTIAPTSANNGFDFGSVFIDGEGGSTDIAGIEYDFYCVDGANNQINTVAVFTSTFTGTSYTGMLNSALDSSADGVVFKSSAGENFKLTSFFIQDADGMDGTWTVTAYENGNPVGTPQTFTIAHSGEYATTVNLSSDFQNIDEVRITVAGGTSGGHIYATLFSDFVVADPVLPDVTAPTVGIVVADNALLAGETSLVTFTFSEAVTGFGNGDLTIPNGTLSAVSSNDSGVTWTATLTPNTGVTDATNMIAIDMTSLTDAASNPGVGTTNSNNYAVATVRPTAGIVVADNAMAIGETSLVTITFSEAVTGFSNADLTIANGSLSAVDSVDGGVTWTATFTPTSAVTDATNLITLANNGVSNAAGNTGSGTTDSNNYAIDTVRPTAGIVVADNAMAIGETSLVTITFSEAVTGFTNADLTIANGSLSTVDSIDGGITWTVTLTPTSVTTDATNLITLDNTGVIDTTGNAGSGTTDSNNYAIDTARPTAGIVVADNAMAIGETSLVTITFSEAVTGFTNADLTIANGSLSTVDSIDGGITWTATLTPTSVTTDATNLITLDNTGVFDTAGNAGSGTTDSNNYAIDTARPTAGIVVADNAMAIGETSLVTITFSEAVTGFTNADLTIANGSLSTVDSIDGGITWTATLTPTSVTTDATNLITLDNTGVFDTAGNAGSGTTDSNNYAIDTARPTAGIVVADNAMAIGETSLVTITFSEAVTGFTNADLTIANGSLSTVDSIDGGITWTATLTPTSVTTDATNLITLDNTGVSDTAGNAGSGTTDSNNYAIDTARPTAGIVVADNAMAIGETSLVTITFSEAVTGFTNADLTIANGSLSTVDSIDGGITWTATLTPTSVTTDATNLITLDNTGVSDTAGNAGSGTTDSNNYAIDTARPTAGIVVADNAMAIGETSLVTITFSEAVTGFTNADLTIANGSLSTVDSIDGGITWTATLTPTSVTTDATNLITLDNTGVSDTTGNAGSGTTDSNNYAIDTARPTAGIVVADTALLAGETSLVTFTFSEAVLDFDNTDLTIANGSLSAVSSSDGGTTYTATFTPTASITDATNVITLANTGVTNTAGNAGSGSTDSNNYAVTTVRPTAGIVVTDTALLAGETSLVTFTFSEAVLDFDNTDLTIANGSLSAVSSQDGGTTYTATFTPTASITDATNVITLANTGVTNAAGNAGSGSTDSNNYAVTTVRPTAGIVVTDTALLAGETSLVTVTFSEAVLDFDNTDLTIANGSLSAVSSQDGGTTYTATFSPTASITDATNVITLANTGVTNAAGNAGSGSTDSNNYAIDTARPAAGIVIADNAMAIGETSLVTITFLEAVTGFSNADLTITNGSLSAVDSIDGGITWTATLTPTSVTTDATNLITLDNTGVSDTAGNAGSSTTDSNNYAIDNVRPTVSIVVSDTALLVGETSLVRFTFSEVVNGFSNADLTINNGTLSAVNSQDGGYTYTATLTPTASTIDATNLITIDNTGVADSFGNAGNGSTDSNNYAIDTVGIVVTGNVTQNEILAAVTTLADVDGLGIISYQWLAGGTAIIGATASTLTLTQAEVDKTISVTAGYTNLQGTPVTVTSFATTAVVNVNDAPTTSLIILASILEHSQARVITQAELLGNAADLDGNNLIATDLSLASSNGTLVDNTDGTWSYTPLLNDVTSVNFTYTITDSVSPTAGTVAATATLAITPVTLTADPVTDLYKSFGNDTNTYIKPEAYVQNPGQNLDLKYQLIDESPDAIIIGTTSNDFIKLAGTGNKAANGAGGNDVLDGSTGSSFLSGGDGLNTFFMDGRATGVTWSTLTDFDKGQDHATIWGWVKGLSTINAGFTDFNTGGATGYTGLTLHIQNLLPDGSASGATNSALNSLTLTGHTLAEFGASSLTELNTQIINGTNTHFIVGQTTDNLGDHGYLLIS
ncbi:Ig-like domain-containing protein [Methylobacter sp. S3L5C]|uniref:Ig-like domain-containing protein n=1 Tax=Methylobacter sp. S3L5C TaxID=2839024 RepID=UPI001FAC375D|nr:Ig-like domain-containing protein [Methylobacter sp. S3L5C]UOA07816.1 DUF4347 domain-containing protein [Methylobacter sp. S3L5C]